MKFLPKIVAALIFQCVLITQANHALAQPNRVVDEKNGFKDFKLGDPKQKWADNIVFEKSVGEMKMYRYDGPCCQQVFDSQVEKILLGFSNQTNKLVVIYITTPHRPYKVLEGYLTHYESGFNNAFGKPQSTEHEYLSGQNLEQWTYTWYGTNSSIDLRAYYGPVENGEMYSSVYVMDKRFVMANGSTKTDSGF